MKVPVIYLSGLLVIIVFFVYDLSYASLSDSFESEGFEARELKLHLSYGLGHSVDEVVFRPRGTATIRNFKGPKYTTQQEKVSLEEIKEFEAMALEDGYYFLSVTIKFPNKDKTFRTFTPIKTLLDSGLSDVICIHLTPSGEIFSISYSMAVSNFFNPPNVLGQKSHRISEQPQLFNTTLSVHSGEVGPVPDTAPYLEKMEMERIARERGEDGRDNRSFLAKYWMYIVPVALLVLLSGASNPEGGS